MESKCRSLLGMSDGEVFKVFPDAMESVKREVRDFRIIVAVGTGRRFKTSSPVECVRPSGDEFARRRESRIHLLISFVSLDDVELMKSFLFKKSQIERHSNGFSQQKALVQEQPVRSLFVLARRKMKKPFTVSVRRWILENLSNLRAREWRVSTLAPKQFYIETRLLCFSRAGQE